MESLDGMNGGEVMFWLAANPRKHVRRKIWTKSRSVSIIYDQFCWFHNFTLNNEFVISPREMQAMDWEIVYG